MSPQQNPNSSIQSIYEAIKEDLILEYGAIQTGNTYRNSVAQCIGAIRHSSQISVFPEIGIHLANRNIPSGMMRAFEPLCDVFVHGTVECLLDPLPASLALRDAASSLLHDMKRVTALIYRKHETVPGKRWRIEDGSVKWTDTVDMGDHPTHGYILFTFKIQALALDVSFRAMP